jgi:hypothetical protein
MNVDEQKKKDLDVEIVDLPDGDDERKRGPERSFMPFPSSIKLASVARQRRFQLILTASIVAIVVVIILGSSLPVRTLAVRLLAARVPTPTATWCRALISFISMVRHRGGERISMGSE